LARQYVCVRFLGKTAIVNTFGDPAEAARLTLQLRRKYCGQRAAFWHQPERITPTETWQTIRRCLIPGRGHGTSKPKPAARSRRRRTTGAPIARPTIATPS